MLCCLAWQDPPPPPYLPSRPNHSFCSVRTLSRYRSTLIALPSLMHRHTALPLPTTFGQNCGQHFDLHRVSCPISSLRFLNRLAVFWEIYKFTVLHTSLKFVTQILHCFCFF